MTSNDIAYQIATISNRTGLHRDRVHRLFDVFREQNGGDSRQAVTATGAITDQCLGNPLRTALEMHRQARHPVDGRDLRLLLPAFNPTGQTSRDEYGDYSSEIHRWSGISHTLPVIRSHDEQARQVADVTGWDELPNRDLAVWVRLRDDQTELRTAALWGELSCSPNIAAAEVEWSRTPSSRHAVIGEARLREVSVVAVGANKLPAAVVTCQACPTSAQHRATGDHGVIGPGRGPATTGQARAYRNHNGQVISVRTFPGTRLTIR